METIESVISRHEGDQQGPRAMKHIDREVRNLLIGDAVGDRETAEKLARLHKEASPFKPSTRVTGLGGTAVRVVETPGKDLQLYVELLVSAQDADKRSDECVAAHPAVAAAFLAVRTQQELMGALEQADRAGHAKLAQALGDALYAAYSCAFDIYELCERPAPLNAFRLNQHNSTLAHNIEIAYERLLEKMSG